MSNGKEARVAALFKAGTLIKGADKKLKLERLPSGISALDDVLGGGWPIGDWTMIVGHESTGKTILTQYAAASNQKHNKKQPLVLYIDVERSYDKEWWEQSGVNTNKVWVLREVTAEDIIDSVVDVLKETDELGMIILDSIAAMTPAIIEEESAARRDIAGRARMMMSFFNKLSSLVFTKGITVVMTNQIRSNIGTPGTTYPGGSAVRYFPHVILRTRRTEWITEGSQRVGFRMEISAEKNKTAPPQSRVELPFTFSSQIDLLALLIEEALEAGLIRNRSPYYHIGPENDPTKILGKNNLRLHVQEHPELAASFKEHLYGK